MTRLMVCAQLNSAPVARPKFGTTSMPPNHNTPPRSPPSRRTSALLGLRRPAPLRGTHIVQVQSRSDESEMRKRLREVSHLPPRLRIVLFRKQTDIVAKG